MYITIRPLAMKDGSTIPRDTRTRLEGLPQKAIDKLIAVGAIRQIQSPPLSELAGWKRRAARLDRMGITTADDFLTAEDRLVAGQLRVKPATVRRWKEQIESFVQVEAESG